MQHETTVVKKAVKKYTTKKGVKKESISININLGAKSKFNDGDKVAVALYDDFKELENISADEIQQLKKDVADKDATITDLNESNAKLNEELKDKFDKINDITAKLKASEKTVADLESDISEKDNIIADLESDIKVANVTSDDHEKIVADINAELISSKNKITEKDKTIADLSAKNDALHERLDELTDLLSGKDKTIDSLDETIVNYKIEIAEYNTIDIDKLKDKSYELDNVKDELVTITKRLDDKSNVISLLQNQIMELQQLVNYKDKENDALQNKGLLDTILNKDITANITAPTLYLIDTSGNLIKENPDIDVDATDVDDGSADNVSGKDRTFKI